MVKRTALLISPIVIGLCLLAIFFEGSQMVLATDWQSKVSPAVLAELNSRSSAEVEVLVQVAAQANLSGAAGFSSKEAKTRFVYDQLTAVAETSQRPLREFLDAQTIEHRSYWINNTIWLVGTTDLIETLASRDDVFYVYANPQVQFDAPESVSEQQADALDALAVEWGIDRIGAPLVWAAGVTGTGVIIAGQDTGYAWDHPALIEQYRGWDSEMMTVTHDYNWHDAIQEDMNGNDSNPCGYQLNEPCDDNSHGTHTMGTMVGDDGMGNQVGVAPGAKWISCRNMEQGYGTPETYIDCFQWFLAPTDLNGENPRPDLAPHIINNSWGCPPFEGCSPDNFPVMEAVVDNLRMAGILVVTSAGNNGWSGCGSISHPAAIYDSSITIGNTNFFDDISSSSSRGPVTVDESGRLKPDLSAPGSSVRSTIPGDSYGIKSGTSMAAPHVAGAFALLISAHPNLAGNVDLLEKILIQTTIPITGVTQTCGEIPSDQFPNNIVGHGRLDVYQAYHAHIVQIADQAPLTATVGVPFTYTFTVTHYHVLSDSGQLVISGSLPADVSVISASVPFTQSSQSVQLVLENLAPSEQQTITMTLQISMETNLTDIPFAWEIIGDNIVTELPPAVSVAIEGRDPLFYRYLPLLIQK